MILRPIDPPPAAAPDFAPAWPVIQRVQQQKYTQCWLVTQPSHAALAAEMAEQCAFPDLPPLTPEMLRAIALHDYGWGLFDAQAIQGSRMRSVAPQSFINIPASQFLIAWQDSINMAQTVSPVGGYMVSRHFYRLALHAIGEEDNGKDRKNLEIFAASEEQRQKKLASQDSHSVAQLEMLTDLLQFCDLLSLYICSGAQDNIVLPKYLGTEVRVRQTAAGLQLEPSVIASGARFTLAALRHPPLKGVSGQEIGITVL